MMINRSTAGGERIQKISCSLRPIFPAARRVLLTDNYRSASNIVAAASQLIQNNRKRAPKVLHSDRPATYPIEFVIENDSQTESWAIVDRMRSELHIWDYSKFAIFIVRTLNPV